jgi:hypothetical protein
VRDGAIVDFPGQWRTLCESLGFVTLHEHHALLVEDHGTQGGLFGADTTHRTERKGFFRRLHEKKRPDLAINYEVVLCMQKRGDTAPGSLEVCVSSPPFHDPRAVTGRDASSADEARQGRSVQRFNEYGATEGQLGAMPAGRLDLCLSSPPYAGAGEVLGPHNGIDYNKAARPTGQALTPGRGMYPYGQSEGQLGSLPAGTLQAVIASPPYAGNVKSDYLLSEDGKTRARDVKRGYKQGHGSFRGSETYGQSEGQLGAMREGTLDLCVSSPPYAGSFHGQDEVAPPEDRIARTSRDPRYGTTGRHSQINHPRGYGISPGNLGNLPEGDTP